MMDFFTEQVVLVIAAVGLLVVAVVVERLVPSKWPSYLVVAAVCVFSMWLGISKHEVLGGPLLALWFVGVLVVYGGSFAKKELSERAGRSA